MTKVIGRIWCCPEFVEDLERLNDKDDGLTVLAEQEGRKFFDVQGRAWAFTGSLTVQPRRTFDCDLLHMPRDAFGAVVEQPSSGIRYLFVLYFCVNAHRRCERSRGSCWGFPPNHEVSYEQVGGVAAEPLGMAFDARRIGLQQSV